MSKKVVYWDSSTFLAHLKQENHGDGVLAAINSQAGAFDRGEIVLASSTLAILEVNSADLSDSVREAFEAMWRRSNMLSVAPSDTVMRKASEIRRHVHGRARNGSGEPYVLSPPDAIHVATALLIPADLLVTLDSKDKSKTREMGMTSVARFYPIAGFHSVAIERPVLGQVGTSLLP